jgi:hypothetical protein
MNIVELLYAVPETGADPDLIESAAGEIERLQAAVQHEKDVAEAYKAEADELRAAIEKSYRLMAIEREQNNCIIHRALVQSATLTEQRTCNWTYDQDDGYWSGDCGIAFCLENETPEANEMHFCPKCGGKLEVKE